MRNQGYNRKMQTLIAAKQNSTKQDIFQSSLLIQKGEDKKGIISLQKDTPFFVIGFV